MKISHAGKRVAVLTAVSVHGEVGGAERFYDGLVVALTKAGCKAERINIVTDESTFEHIQENYARCASLDLDAYDLVISTKAPTYMVVHRNHVLYLVHTIRVFYDMFEQTFLRPTAELQMQRKWVHEQDNRAFRRIARRFAIGHEVANRMQSWNGLSCEVLHPPLASSGFYDAGAGTYFLLPGRLHRWKRVHLAVDAILASKERMRLLVVGTGEAEEELRNRAGGDPRIEFLGYVDDARLGGLYANSLAVLFLAEREDYGYVTLEAFASSKPVLTCSDSGEPLRFVEHGVTGVVCEPCAESIRGELERLWAGKDKCSLMGRAGKERTVGVVWPHVVSVLLDSAFGGQSQTMESDAQGEPRETKAKVAILDMQPVLPAVGGGRLRLLGLYHALGRDIEARYVGTYDWPGEQYRLHQISENLSEETVPLSDEHFKAAADLAALAGGRNLIDVAFHKQAHLSPTFIRACENAVSWADIVVFSHPWVYPLMKRLLTPEKMVVYDAHNVEGVLRAQLLDENNETQAAVLKEVVAVEYELCARADLVVTCSNEDSALFASLYAIPLTRIRVAPNGVFTSTIYPPTNDKKTEASNRLGRAPERHAAIFLGSDYSPNVEAATFIVKEIAPALKEVDFVIAGGVGQRLLKDAENVVVTGPLDEAGKLTWLHASSIAINPMFSGSGTNIKMFDFMAAGLPIVTTEIGARGIILGSEPPFRIVGGNWSSFLTAIKELLLDKGERNSLSKEARRWVSEMYAWEVISPQLGFLLRKFARARAQRGPTISVIVPTFERHEMLGQLMNCLRYQTWRDFEVVVVDQSEQIWDRRQANFGFPLAYWHTPVQGAVRARNTGAMLSSGEILAFTDDDCRPEPSWLQNAAARFRSQSVVGIEGLIFSDHLDDPNYRPVSNVGFEGIGFMTANLFVRQRDFMTLGGFDLSFDRPHFREDTDFGWRLQDRGEVPYCDDVRVFHPAQDRSVERESTSTRARFFEKDALLYQKHPLRYVDLLYKEAHWARSADFWRHFHLGGERYQVDLSPFDAVFRYFLGAKGK